MKKMVINSSCPLSSKMSFLHGASTSLHSSTSPRGAASVPYLASASQQTSIFDERWPLKFVILILAIICLLFSCSEGNHELREWLTPGTNIKVLATTAMIADVVQEIGGEEVETLTLIKDDLDPHSYQLVKGDDEKLSFADIVFYSGLGLEHGASLKYALEQRSSTVAVGDAIVAKNPTAALFVDGQIDPHIWMDISLWSMIVPSIVETLSQRSPEHTQLFQERGDRLQEKMTQAHLELLQFMRLIPPEKRFLVTTHDAFGYFTRAYLAEPGEKREDWENRFASPEGLAPDSQLSVQDIRAIINHLSVFKIQVIFPECNVSQDSLRKIIQAGLEEGLEITIAPDCLYADSMPKGESYIDMLWRDAKLMHHYWMET